MDWNEEKEYLFSNNSISNIISRIHWQGRNEPRLSNESTKRKWYSKSSKHSFRIIRSKIQPIRKRSRRLIFLIHIPVTTTTVAVTSAGVFQSFTTWNSTAKSWRGFVEMGKGRMRAWWWRESSWIKMEFREFDWIEEMSMVGVWGLKWREDREWWWHI